MHLWFLQLSQTGVVRWMAHALAMVDCKRVEREVGPTGAILDA